MPKFGSGYKYASGFQYSQGLSGSSFVPILLPSLYCAGTGTVSITASAAITLPELSLIASTDNVYIITATITLPAFTLTSTQESSIIGDASIVLPEIVGNFQGILQSGVVTGTNSSIGSGSSWKTIEAISVGSSGWTSVVGGWVGEGGTWKKFFTMIPNQVTGLVVDIDSPITYDQLNLTWDAVTSASGYSVESSTDSSNFSEIGTTTSPTVTYPDTGLSDGQKYYYRVRAIIDTAYGEYSEIKNNIVPMKPPTLASVTKDGTLPWSKVNLSYSDGGSDTETEIRVYVSTTSDSSGFSRASVLGFGGDPFAASSTSDSITGLSPGTQYWFKLVNYNSVYGESAASSVVSETMEGAPSAPQWSAGYPQDSGSDDTSILLKLDASTGTGVINYQVYYNIGSNMILDPSSYSYLGQFTTTEIVSADYGHDTGQSHGTVVYYAARAVGSGGTSGFGSTGNATVLENAPSAPTSFTATGTDGGTIQLTWVDASSNEDGFYLYRSTSTSFTPNSSTVIYTGSAGLQLYDDAGLVEGTTYYYRIASYNQGGTTLSGTEASAQAPWTVPTDVTSVTASAQCNGILLNWNDHGGVREGYKVYYKRTSDPTFVEAASEPGINDTQYTIDSVVESLSDSTSYDCEVRPYNGIYEGNSNTDTTTTTGPPTAFTSVTISNPQPNTIRIEWAGASNAASFSIFRNLGEGWEGTPIISGLTSFQYDYTNWVTPLGNPVSLTVNSYDDNEITFSWTDSGEQGDSIRIWRKTGVGGTYSEVSDSPMSAVVTSYHDGPGTGLDPSTDYYYRIAYYRSQTPDDYAFKVRATSGCSSYVDSNAGIAPGEISTIAPDELGAYTYVNQTTLARQLPTAPDNPDAIDNSTTIAAEITITWSNTADNQDGFVIYRSEDGGPYTVDYATIADPSANLYNDSSVSFGSGYQYRIYAYNTAGNSTSYAQTAEVFPTSGGGEI